MYTYPPITPLCLPPINILPMDILEEVTDYQTLSALVRRVCECINNINELIKNLNLTAEAVKELQEAVTALQKEFEKIKNGEYMEIYIEALGKWIDKNLIYFVSKIVKYVFFGLTDDGYFAAYIPDSWDFIDFYTPLDPSSEEYGHLWLYY